MLADDDRANLFHSLWQPKSIVGVALGIFVAWRDRHVVDFGARDRREQYRTR
jgi:hypothetical protein